MFNRNIEARINWCKKLRLKDNKFWKRVVFSVEYKLNPEKCGRKWVREYDEED